MLSYLRVWWASRGRELFVYYDGRKWRRGDPIALATALEAACPKYVELAATATQDITKLPMGEMREEAEKARKMGIIALSATARKVFTLPALGDTNGLTDLECLGVLFRFFAYMEELAEAARVFGLGGSRSGPAAGASPQNPVGSVVAPGADS